MLWHVILNEDNQVLAVYGEALLGMAQEKLAQLVNVWGWRMRLSTQEFKKRPSVGNFIKR